MSKDWSTADILYAEENIFQSQNKINDRPACTILQEDLSLSDDGEFINGTMYVDGEGFGFSYDLLAEEYEVDNYGMPLPDVFYNDVYGLISLEVSNAINEFIVAHDIELPSYDEEER